jgi:Tfp pilus assembly protein FimV
MISQRSASARALVIISTIVAGLVLLLATAVHAFGGSAPIDTIDYQVRSGDSLWSIAEVIAPPGSDVRAVVASIRDLNDLPGAVIHAGDVIEVPADA